MTLTVFRAPIAARLIAVACLLSVSACTSGPEVTSDESSDTAQTDVTLSSGAPETSPTTAAPTTSAPTTAAPTTAAPTTTTTAAVTIDFDGPSVSRSAELFLGERRILNELISDDDPEIELLDIPVEGFATVSLEDGRAATGAFATDAGFLGFVVDEPSGAVLAVVMIIDPDGETAAELFLTTFGIAGEPGPTFNELSSAYADVVSTGVVDVPRYVVSGTNDFVIRLNEGANPNDELVSVVIAPTTDQATAIGNAEDLEVDALASIL